ncbi:MAG: hypothetical protein ACI361_07075 [Atopobiaceae bacterium]
MGVTAAGLICGLLAALPGVLLLELVRRKKTEARLGKAFGALAFSFVLLMAAFAMVYVQKPKDVLMFGVSAIGVFLSVWVVEAVRSAVSSD